jgi:translation initiation factor SUI1
MFNAEEELKEQTHTIHIRVQRKSARQCLTIVEGLVVDVKMVKKLKKLFNCGGSIIPENVIQLMGDHGEGVKQYLINNNIADDEQIILHKY